MNDIKRFFDDGLCIFEDSNTQKIFCFDTNTYALYNGSGCSVEQTFASVKQKQKKPSGNFSYKYTRVPDSCDTLTFMLTSNCNMRCTYCYYGDKLETSCTHLSFDDIKTYFELFQRYYKKGIKTIHFFGGEPLIMYPLIKKSILYIEDYCNNKNIVIPEFSINTNGLLLSESIIDFFYEHKVNLCISLDGKKENNRCRIKKDGTETFDDISNNMKLIHTRYPDYQINVESTFTFKNVLDFHQSGVHDIESFHHLGVKSLHLVPVMIDENDELNPFASVSTLEMTLGYIKYAYDYMFKSLKTNNPIFVDDYYALVMTLQRKIVKTVDCHAGIAKFAISPSGDCYPCHIGVTDNSQMISSDILFDKDKFFAFVGDIIKKYDRNLNSECSKCWCKNICDRCRHQKETNLSCRYKRDTYEYMLRHIVGICS